MIECNTAAHWEVSFKRERVSHTRERDRVQKGTIRWTKQWLGGLQVWLSLSVRTSGLIATVNRLILLISVASRAGGGGG